MDREALLQWYGGHARALPWRAEPDCYRVWLSEIMAQQTRIETMLPYWERFLARWPTVQDLAAASVDDVLLEWAGLGYYSRARKLHQAATRLAREGWPQSAVGLRALPGIGEYTAAAIASIALDQDVAAVDGNVERVVCRRSGYDKDPCTAEGRREVRRVADEWLWKGRAGDWNQAMMELGARICTPRRPRCSECPVRRGCVAHQQGSWHQLPNKPRRQKAPEVRAVCLALRREGKLLLGKRPPKGLLASLWELPQTPIGEGETARAALGRLAADMGLAIQAGWPLGSIRHIFSHRKLTLEVWELQADGKPEPGAYVELGWGTEGRGLSTCASKALQLTGQPSLLAAEGAPNSGRQLFP